MTIRLPIPKTQFDLKIQGQRSRSKYPSQRSVKLTHFLSVSHQGILNSCPLCPWQSGFPFPRHNLTWKFKVKGQDQSTPVSAVSSWLIFLVFHIRASYQLPSLLFHDNWASHSQDTIWPWKFKVKGQGQGHSTLVSVTSSWLISFLFCINWTNHSKDMAKRMFDWGKGI